MKKKLEQIKNDFVEFFSLKSGRVEWLDLIDGQLVNWEHKAFDPTEFILLNDQTSLICQALQEKQKALKAELKAVKSINNKLIYATTQKDATEKMIKEIKAIKATTPKERKSKANRLKHAKNNLKAINARIKANS